MRPFYFRLRFKLMSYHKANAGPTNLQQRAAFTCSVVLVMGFNDNSGVKLWNPHKRAAALVVHNILAYL
jgi:hypothetical protein